MTVDAGLKRYFAEEIRAAAGLPEGAETERLVQAFAAVPREAHVHPGPWLLRSAAHFGADRRTRDADPAHLYHNVLIALDEAKGINIGDPSLWARLLAVSPIVPGSRILQIGAGSGYFTAIMAEMSGPSGRVVATEVEDSLATLAERALAGRDSVTLIRSDGAAHVGADRGPFDLIVAFAGVTHPPQVWADALAPGGRMLLPVTSADWWGAMALFHRTDTGFTARTLGRCGFYPCRGARDPATEAHLATLWSDPAHFSGATFEVTVQDGTATYLPTGP